MRFVFVLVLLALVVLAARWVDIPGRFMGKKIQYSVATNGEVSQSRDDFAAQVVSTLKDSRGWRGAGLRFEEVLEGGLFTIILAQPDKLPEYSEGCSVEWSCRVGDSVIVNDSLWANSSDSWVAAGLPMDDYHHMTVNHEVGHFLGHPDNETPCSGPGNPAPIMIQQSIDLQGCAFNPWPLESELTYSLPD
jgi:hypothetical protein